MEDGRRRSQNGSQVIQDGQEADKQPMDSDGPKRMTYLPVPKNGCNRTKNMVMMMMMK